jgi:multiple sugar transport system permease protein
MKVAVPIPKEQSIPPAGPAARTRYRRSTRTMLRRYGTRALLFGLMIGVCTIYVIPTYWVISTSFKSQLDALAIPPKWFNFTPTLENYRVAFVDYDMLPNFKNSVIVALFSTLLALALGTPAAYALSRFPFRGREGVMMWFLGTRMGPPILVALPFFLLSRSIGLYDHLILLIFVDVLTTLAWVVFMMRSFFDDIPIDIDESALIDGTSWLGALRRVVMPLAIPGLVATTVFCLILSWNEYFFALILTSVNAKTLPAAITSFMTVHGLLWGPMTAAGTVVMLPILIFTLWMQKYLIRGMTMGAIK